MFIEDYQEIILNISKKDATNKTKIINRKIYSQINWDMEEF